MTSNSKMTNKQAKAALDKFKYEVANEIGVNLKQGYNGDLTSKEAGSIGGEMVKKLVAQAANQMQSQMPNQ
ncbi:small acid-soluble spore proteins alpha/beta type [Clostridium sp. CAG:921]|nr:small acid-soluble spore proteins alpha/beta type [Clostridium sp. CAG:921]